MMEKNDFSDPNQREIHSASPSSSDKEGRNEREGLTWTDDEERKIRRKLDFRVVPLVTLLYLLCFLDRANVGQYASDLHSRGQRLILSRKRSHPRHGHRIGPVRCQVQLGPDHLLLHLHRVSINELLPKRTHTDNRDSVEIPSNIILKAVGPRFWIPFLVFSFGLCSMCTAFVQTHTGLYVARAFLGLAEGGTMPGIAFFLSCFYKRNELLFRIGIFVSASSLAGAFGGLLAAGLVRIPEFGTAALKLHTWRHIFFFEGLFTVIVALIAPFFMQTHPDKCKFFTPREQQIAAERLFREHRANVHEKVRLEHVKRAIFNVNSTVCAFGFFAVNVTVQSFSLFLPTLLRDMGHTTTMAQLYSVAPYCVACILSIAVAFASDRTRLRGIYLATFPILCVIGFTILRTVDDPNLKYMAVFFSAAGAFPGGPGFLSWGLNNAAGPAVRAVTGGYIVSIGSFGAILAT
jgi:sugar phosphate permease